MPILVTDYTWTENKEKIHITVPLKGVKAGNVDLLSTDEFIKVNFPPFLFEVLLHNKIDDDNCTAKIRAGCVEFNLTKQEPAIWGELKSSRSSDKKFMLQKKLEAVKYVQSKTEEKIKSKAEEKSRNKKYALNEMMKLEQGEKERIEKVKDHERTTAAEDMEKWKAARKYEEELERKKMMEQRIDSSLPDAVNSGQEVITNQKKTKQIFNVEESTGMEQESAPIPTVRTSKPRDGGNIKFTFTPRVFPTPLRESKVAEEEAWLQKQAEARKITEVDDPDLQEHEKDPGWLKDKGNKLFASGNFLAAVNAYNLAIRMQPKQHSLYLNRSACHLKLRNLYKCIEDCSSALDLLQPPVPANATSRLKAHVRKGAAFCELELYAEGLMDYEAALQIDPENEDVKRDAAKIREIIEKGGAIVKENWEMVDS